LIVPLGQRENKKEGKNWGIIVVAPFAEKVIHKKEIFII